MSIADLIAMAGPHNKFFTRHGEKNARQYESDLIEVVNSGQHVPIHALWRYFKTEYGMVLSRDSISAHLEKIRNEGKLW